MSTSKQVLEKYSFHQKMMNYQPQQSQKREIVDIEKLNINTNLKKAFSHSIK